MNWLKRLKTQRGMSRERSNLLLDLCACWSPDSVIFTPLVGILDPFHNDSQSNSQLNFRPWMADQEVNFPAVTYWEGAVRFEGTCAGKSVNGNGYIELTGYAGNLPLP